MPSRIGIDVGGTFTDFLLVDEGDTFEIYKTLTTPADRSEGVMRGLHDLAGQHGASLADFLAGVEMIVHATTAATNALLTNTGVKTGLLTTHGFRDALEMRRGIKEEIYDNKYPHPKPLVPRRLRLPVRERVNYRGVVLSPVPQEDIHAAVAKFRAHGVQAVAICFLNSYTNPENEVAAAALLAREMPDAYVTVSTTLLPEIRFYERVSTTAVNAYLGPILAGYLGVFNQKLKDAGFRGTLLIMKSNGGVMSVEQAMKTAAGTVLSGPAAGAVAGAAYAGLQGHRDSITVDMGGTSLDVALIKDGAPVVVTDASINRCHVALPTVDVHSVGAGGGSIAWIDEGGLLQVGPQSAGADPGPACYGFGGENATVTDADLLLGYLNPEYFLGGRMHLRKELAHEAIRRVAQPLGLDVLQAAAGIYQVVNVNMAAAVKEVTIKRGYDPRDFPLVVAGGAGPVHAAMVAAELEVPLVIIPRHSSIFTAGGLLLSDLKHDYTRTFFGILGKLDLAQLARVCADMEDEGKAAFRSEGLSAERMEMAYALSVRYAGQYHEIVVTTSRETIQAGDLQTLEGEFHRVHDRIFGYCLEGQPVELVNVRLTCVGRMPRLRFPELTQERPHGQRPLKGRRPIFLPIEAEIAEVDVWDGDHMTQGDEVHGPAVIEQVTTSILVPSGYRVHCDRYGNYVMIENANCVNT